jgi:hypothetical protein
MKSKEQRQQEAKVRQAEYNKLSAKQKLMKLDLQVGDNSATQQRTKILLEIESTGAIAEGVGDSINKKEKKAYHKPKRS